MPYWTPLRFTACVRLYVCRACTFSLFFSLSFCDLTTFWTKLNVCTTAMIIWRIWPLRKAKSKAHSTQKCIATPTTKLHYKQFYTILVSCEFACSMLLLLLVFHFSTRFVVAIRCYFFLTSSTSSRRERIMGKKYWTHKTNNNVLSMKYVCYITASNEECECYEDDENKNNINIGNKTVLTEKTIISTVKISFVNVLSLSDYFFFRRKSKMYFSLTICLKRCHHRQRRSFAKKNK